MQLQIQPLIASKMNFSVGTSFKNCQTGFTLVEMAMVLMIVALLLGGLLPTISSQVEQRHENDTRKQLDEIQQALIGYAIINGRLPCPATSGSTPPGTENPAGGGNCATFTPNTNGYVPAATLGLSGATSSGLVLDSWGNPIRYAVTNATATVTGFNGGSTFNVFTFPGGISAVGISKISPNLLVCSSSTASGFSPGVSCGANNALTSSPGVPVVLFSTGKDGPQGGGADELANLANKLTFISHTPTPSPNQFNDIVIWLSPNILVNRMVSAGKLP